MLYFRWYVLVLAEQKSFRLLLNHKDQAGAPFPEVESGEELLPPLLPPCQNRRRLLPTALLCHLGCQCRPLNPVFRASMTGWRADTVMWPFRGRAQALGSDVGKEFH